MSLSKVIIIIIIIIILEFTGIYIASYGRNFRGAEIAAL